MKADPAVPAGGRVSQVQGGLLAGGGRDGHPRPRRADQHQAEGTPGAGGPQEGRRPHENSQHHGLMETGESEYTTIHLLLKNI